MVKSKLLTDINLIYYFGDKKDAINLEKMKLSYENIILAEQIHSNKVAILKGSGNKFIKKADGMVTNKKIILGIRTADCLPILFFDPEKMIIAAVHAGWKGLYKGIIANATDCMKKLGSNILNICAVVGPHIQICCYSVSEERIKKFQKLVGSNKIARFNSRSWHLDLTKIAFCQLRALGLKTENIEISDICTSCNNRFWSFRQDKQNSGRMINLIGMIAD